MKKTIFIVVALSLLLCATVFAGPPNPRISTGQKVTIPFLIGKYASGQTMNTRIHILNNDAALPISVAGAFLIDPDGNNVIFTCDENGNEVEEYDNLVDPNTVGNAILLEPYESASINVPAAMFLCSKWNTSKFPLDSDGYIILNGKYLDGGRPFIEVWWGSSVEVIPPTVWAFFRSIKDSIRVDFERWEGRVTEELAVKFQAK